jgi:hypothetical protein
MVPPATAPEPRRRAGSAARAQDPRLHTVTRERGASRSQTAVVQRQWVLCLPLSGAVGRVPTSPATTPLALPKTTTLVTGDATEHDCHGDRGREPVQVHCGCLGVFLAGPRLWNIWPCISIAPAPRPRDDAETGGRNSRWSYGPGAQLATPTVEALQSGCRRSGTWPAAVVGRRWSTARRSRRSRRRKDGAPSARRYPGARRAPRSVVSSRARRGSPTWISRRWRRCAPVEATSPSVPAPRSRWSS